MKRQYEVADGVTVTVELGDPEPVALSDIVFDAKIYPREQHSGATVNQYAEAMRAGSEFPPVVLEAGTLRLIDGKHRWLAAKEIAEEGQGELPAQLATIEGLDRDLPPDKETGEVKPNPKYDPTIREIAHELQVDHGDRPTRKESEDVARGFAKAWKDDPLRVTDLARMHRVPVSTMYNWVGPILRAQVRAQRCKAWRLGLLGGVGALERPYWSLRAIAKAVFGDESKESAVRRLFRTEKTTQSDGPGREQVETLDDIRAIVRSHVKGGSDAAHIVETEAHGRHLALAGGNQRLVILDIS